MRSGMFVAMTFLVLRALYRLGDRIIFGSGAVIARRANAHLRHGGTFEACRL